MWLELYKLASEIASPIALAATTVLLFFLLLRFVVNKLEVPIKKITGKHAFVLVFTVITYGMILAGVALAGGIGLFAYQSIYENLADKEKLIRDGDAAISNQEGKSAENIAQKILSRWPQDVDGHRILGSALFLQEKYTRSGAAFLAAAEAIDQPVCDTAKRNMYANAAAAFAMADDFSESLRHMDRIRACDLEKGMTLNYAKLLVFVDRADTAIELISSSDLLREGRPDYRDRAFFLLGTAKLIDLRSEPNDDAYDTSDASDAFVKSACLNSDFEKLFASTVVSRDMDPPGALIQSYRHELEVLSDPEYKEFRATTFQRMREECSI